MAQLVRQPVCLGCNFFIQVVFHQGIKLNTQQPPLGQHSAVLLDEIAEVLLERRVCDNHRLAKESANLGAANVEHIAEICQVFHGHIIARGSQTVAQPRTIHKQIKSTGAADGGE